MTRKPSNAVALLATARGESDSRTDQRSKQIQEAAQERSPVRLFLEDVILLAKNLRLFPYIFLPRRKVPALPGVTKHTLRSVYGWVIIFLLTLIQIPLLTLALPAFFVLPGWAFAAAAVVSLLLIYALAWTTWGTLVVESKVEGIDKSTFPEEKWFFLNGITTR